MTEKKIPIVELFGPTVQGEGALAGQVSFFIRSGGCGYRCHWCDSMHAVDPKQVKQNATRMTAKQVVQRIIKLRDGGGTSAKQRSRTWVTLSGGDPVMWDMDMVIVGLYLAGFRVVVETQGAMWRDWLEHCDLVTVSPKPPSSGMDEKFDLTVLQKYWARLHDRMVLKVVVFDGADLEFASRVRRVVPEARLFLSSGTPQYGDTSSASREEVCLGYKSLADLVLSRPEFHDAVVLPQLHVLLWGRELGR